MTADLRQNKPMKGTDYCSSHNQLQLKCGCSLPLMSAACSSDLQKAENMPIAEGMLNGKKVLVLRDSGSSCVVVKEGLIEHSRELNEERKTVHVYLANGKAVPAPVTEVYLESPYFSGKVSALEMANPMYDVILGNVPGARCPGISVMEPKGRNHGFKSKEVVMAGETRAGKMRRSKSLQAIDIGTSVSELKDLQNKDETLVECRKLAATGEIRRSGRGNRTKYTYEEKSILIRIFSNGRAVLSEKESKQAVVPQSLRGKVMKVAYDSIVGGHFLAKKTTDKMLETFFWPNIWNDVKRFCQSGDQGQRWAPGGRASKASLPSAPLIWRKERRSENQYNFRLACVKAIDKHGSDCLSRLK